MGLSFTLLSRLSLKKKVVDIIPTTTAAAAYFQYNFLTDLLGFTLFKQPNYLLFAQSLHPWKVDAQEGTLYEDQRIQFETNVEITSLDEQGYIQVIRTDFVEVNLQDKTIYSDQAVEIIGPNYVINSNGFTASLETQRYELLDHVKTVYQPTSSD